MRVQLRSALASLTLGLLACHSVLPYGPSAKDGGTLDHPGDKATASLDHPDASRADHASRPPERGAFEQAVADVPSDKRRVLDSAGDVGPAPVTDAGCGACVAGEECTACGCEPSLPRICVATAGYVAGTMHTSINNGQLFTYQACVAKIATIFANQFLCGAVIPGGTVVDRWGTWGSLSTGCVFAHEVCP